MAVTEEFSSSGVRFVAFINSSRLMPRATTRRGEWAGIEKVSIHRIRRTVASNLIVNGVPSLVVSDWLGHEPEVDARHYQYNTLTLAEQRRLLEDTETKIIPFREAV